MNLLAVILIPLLGAGATAWMARYGRTRCALTAAATALLALLALAPLMSAPLHGHLLLHRIDWVPQLGLSLSLRLDGLALMFALLILVMGLLVILYASYYLSHTDRLGRFFAYLLLFMGAMLGVVLAENLILLLIFWELTSLTSFLLIGYWHHRQDARRGARMALAITGMGGLALLGGVVLLGSIVGSYELSVVLASGDLVRADPRYPLMLVLILLGAFTKSAQFPFHFWLPRAMAAPTPVSAYLHSATMVKAGIFLLARLFPVLSGTDLWGWLVAGAGLATLLSGAWLALFQHDLKGLLAYSTISHLGLIVLLFGLGTPLAAVAGLFHVLNHAIFKASLFMAAGIIDHECGTRDMRRINGLWSFMPYTATLAMVAAASMAGVPLFNGFLSKEMFFAETADYFAHFDLGWIPPLLVVVAGVLAVAYSLRFIHDVFFNGQPVDLPRRPHEPPAWMIAPVELLVALCLLVGIAPGLTVEPWLKAAAEGLLQAPPPEFHLAVWHGLGPAVVMSVVALVGGVLLYAMRQRLFALARRVHGRIDAGRWFECAVMGLIGAGRWLTAPFERESLQWRILLLTLAALVLGSGGFVLGLVTGDSGIQFGDRIVQVADPVSVLLALALIAITLTTVALHRQRMVAVIVSGGIGLLIALIFARFSAPDLALTQLAVETVTVILLLLALYFLPQYSPTPQSRGRHGRDLAVAVVAGVGATLLTWALLGQQPDSISEFFLANSVPGGGGKNVVNVILVDFRGFDTLGEITVLAIAALGIHAMLRELRLGGLVTDPAGRPWNWDRHPAIMAALARLTMPLLLMVALFIFLRGHNAPGGGFIAGLITAAAVIMQYLTNGVDWTHQRLAHDMRGLIAGGLLIAGLTGLASLLFGHSFLTSAFTHLHWPLLGDFELASALAFDLGVYLVVIGATLQILIQLGLMHDATHVSVLPQEGR